MNDAAGSLSAQLNDGARQIDRVGWGAALVAHYFQLCTARGQLQNGVRKTFSSRAKKPGSPDDAAVGKTLRQLHFRLGLRLPVNATRRPGVVGRVRRCFGPIENIVRAE